MRAGRHVSRRQARRGRAASGGGALKSGAARLPAAGTALSYPDGVDFSQFLTTPVTWWEVLLAVIAVLAGWIASRFAKKGVVALMGRVPNASPALVTFAARFTQYTLLLLGLGVALALLGANLQPLLAIVIIVGLVVVLVLRGVADNFAAGVLIQTRRSATVGDELMVEGPDGEPIVGTVSELNSRSVILTTVDGRTVHVPNAQLLANALVNHSRHGARRSEVQVRVERTADTSVDDVLTRVTDAAASVDGVLSSAPARALAVSVSSDRVVARVQYWHHPLRGVPITSDVVRAVAETLGDAGWKGTVTSTPGPPPLVPSDTV